MLLICYSMLYCEESTWNPLFPVESVGIHLESIWNPWNACGIFHVESMWIIHMDSMDSRWNLAIPCGICMEKNHQNGWGFTQNIFHME